MTIQQRPLFENTPVLNNNFEHDDFGDYDYYDDIKCQMTSNVKWH